MTTKTNTQKLLCAPKETDHYSTEWLEWTRAIRSLNDAFRLSFTSTELYCSPGILALPVNAQSEILDRVRAYRAFNAVTDPHHNHGHGFLVHDSHRVVWTIYYHEQDNAKAKQHLLKPLNIDLTKRHMMIMLDHEWWEDLPEEVF